MEIQYPVLAEQEPEQAVKTIQAYLFQLAEQLNYALEQVDRNTTITVRQTATQAVEEAGKNMASIGQVRDMIIKTAEIIREENDVLSTQLNYKYEAISSQFGTYKKEVSNQIKADGQAIEADIMAAVGIEAVNGSLGTLNSFMAQTQGFIRMGYIDEDEDSAPVIGIAVGRDLKVTMIDGMAKIDRNQNCAFYMPDGVSFRVNGKEIAYFNTQGMSTGDVRSSTGKLELGDKWQIRNTAQNHLTIRWIGG